MRPTTTRPGANPWAIVLLGLPGAGKGTQAVALARLLGVEHFATGNIFREAIRRGDELGATVARYADSGQLVPDSLTRDIVLQALSERVGSPGVILDGFPRTEAQARYLNEFLDLRLLSLLAYQIDVPIPALLERLAGRRVCASCGRPYHVIDRPPAVAGHCDDDGTALVQRSDDRADTVQRRFEVQAPQLAAVVDHYAHLGLLRVVPGAGSSEAVTAGILDAMAADLPDDRLTHIA